MLNQDERELLTGILKAVDGGRKIFGFKVQELAVIGSLLMTLTAFYLRTNNTLDKLVVLSQYTQNFMSNSDNYHSTITGSQFFQGKPTNPAYETGKFRQSTER